MSKNRQATGNRRGLRWSPKPVKDYVTMGVKGGALSGLLQTFLMHPDVWNLFWITAVQMEVEPLTNQQVEALYLAADGTANAKFLGHRCGDLALALTPTAFAKLIEDHPVEAAALPLGKMFKHRFNWVLAQRSEFFYAARVSDFGLGVPVPEPMKETDGSESAKILRLYQLGRSGPG